ncbi:MAG: glycosyltransferase, partial [Candidatus Moranbacteria bacterium]|nr:glycosyltransferase [Candidatus Moranbacteria bacterium]
ILQIHKYFSKERGGGSVTAFFETKKLLEGKGHQVIVFSMDDPRNEKSVYSKYFIKHFDINKAVGFFGRLRWAFKSIYNFEAQRKLEELIKAEKPEVAHIHNIYHYLTPAIFRTLKKNNIPMVFKLSDYKAICPNYKLFNKGQICEKCKGGKYYNCFLNKCFKNSWLVSWIAMKEAYLHKFLRSYQKIDYFLAPSQFMKKKCVEFGILAEKIKILRNVVDVEDFSEKENSVEENYFLYYGRISEEKGIVNLIKAVDFLKNKNLLRNNKLKIAGKGPQEANLKKIVSQLGLKTEVEFLGFKKGRELKVVIRKAKFTVLPSVWYDNSPLVISEAQLLGRPVIISDVGGSEEMIENNKTGMVFEASDVNDLALKIKKMLEFKKEVRLKMGAEGRKNIIKLNNSERYYKKLMAIYKELIQKDYS